MSEPENFLERWSKRKLAKAEPAASEQDAGAPQTEEDNAVPAPAMETNATNAEPESQVFDAASLPSIESIGANTDVTAFLRPGVPPELTRAALRRAWSTDPAIRDFVGLVENGWDFNDPNAMAGFGPITAGEAARLLAQAMGELPELAEKVLAELPKQAALRDAQDRPTLPAQAAQPAAGESEASAPSESADVRRNITVTNDAPQKESGG
jgi:hypothetical protein